MIWMCGLDSNKVTKRLKFCWREIPIIVFGLHLHNYEKQPNSTLFLENMGTNYREPR